MARRTSRSSASSRRPAKAARRTKASASKATKPAKPATPASPSKTAKRASVRQVTPRASAAPVGLLAAQLANVRAVCASLPGVSERPSHGHPTFFIGKKTFAYFLDDHHGDGRLALWCAAAPGAQAMLVDSNPAHYFVPPYVGHMGWIGVRLDRDVPWPQIAAVLEAAYDHRLAKRSPAR